MNSSVLSLLSHILAIVVNPVSSIKLGPQHPLMHVIMKHIQVRADCELDQYCCLLTSTKVTLTQVLWRPIAHQDYHVFAAVLCHSDVVMQVDGLEPALTPQGRSNLPLHSAYLQKCMKEAMNPFSRQI